jgi:hypothetical protein
MRPALSIANIAATADSRIARSMADLEIIGFLRSTLIPRSAPI